MDGKQWIKERKMRELIAAYASKHFNDIPDLAQGLIADAQQSEYSLQHSVNNLKNTLSRLKQHDPDNPIKKDYKFAINLIEQAIAKVK